MAATRRAVSRRPHATQRRAATPVSTLDPTAVTRSSRSAAPPAELLGKPGEGWALTQKLLDRAAILFAWEQVGGADAALKQAKEYALGRYAFGRPIASYQAIKHKLANAYIKNTLARSNCYYGAWALNADAAGTAARRGDCAGVGDTGVLLRIEREHPDPRRHGLHVGVRLPVLLSPLEAAVSEHRQRRRVARPADHRRRTQQRRLTLYSENIMDFNDSASEAAIPRRSACVAEEERTDAQPNSKGSTTSARRSSGRSASTTPAGRACAGRRNSAVAARAPSSR